MHGLSSILAEGLRRLGHETGDEPFFDTLRVRPGNDDCDVRYPAGDGETHFNTVNALVKTDLDFPSAPPLD